MRLFKREDPIELKRLASVVAFTLTREERETVIRVCDKLKEAGYVLRVHDVS